MKDNRVKILKNTDAVKCVKENDNTVLFHVCNDRGVMGAGIAKQVAKEFPTAYDNYVLHYGQFGEHCLGMSVPSFCGKVINLIAQRKYINYDASCKHGLRYIDYGAFQSCIDHVDLAPNTTIVIPYNMGAGLAGGNFIVVMELLLWGLEDFNFVICKLDD